jgi:hypothetical protein
VSGLTHPKTPSFHIEMKSCTSGDTLISYDLPGHTYLPDNMTRISLTVSPRFDNPRISLVSTVLAA